MNPEINPLPAPILEAALPVLVPASMGRRFVNHVIDRLLCFSLLIVVAVILGIMMSVGALAFLHLPDNSLTSLVISTVLCLIVYPAYYYGSEHRSGRTLAKYLTNTQAVSMTGQRLSRQEAIGRTLARLIPLDEISIFWGRGRLWHDSLSNTLVVSASSLPAELQPRHPQIMKVVAVLLLALLPGVLFAWMGYEAVTGGERFDLPRQMPADLHLTKFETRSNDHADFYILTYEGAGRTIEVTRLIAGYNFDPHSDCVLTRPTKQSFNYVPIPTDLSCQKLIKTKKYEVYQVKTTSTNESLNAITPHYYLSYPPYRYAIKALKGSISADEITAMAADSREVTASELETQARH